jgi:hypothetical protein
MDHFDFVCDEGLSSLRVLLRTPDDRREPLVSLRTEIHCTDCVAGLDVESECWQGLAKLFSRNDDTRGSAAWISTAGEWKLHITLDDSGSHTICCEIDSLLDVHRWVLRTRFTMSSRRFRQTADDFLVFLGNCG